MLACNPKPQTTTCLISQMAVHQMISTKAIGDHKADVVDTYGSDGNAVVPMLQQVSQVS